MLQKGKALVSNGAFFRRYPGNGSIVSNRLVSPVLTDSLRSGIRAFILASFPDRRSWKHHSRKLWAQITASRVKLAAVPVKRHQYKRNGVFTGTVTSPRGHRSSVNGSNREPERGREVVPFSLNPGNNGSRWPECDKVRQRSSAGLTRRGGGGEDEGGRLLPGSSAWFCLFPQPWATWMLVLEHKGAT